MHSGVAVKKLGRISSDFSDALCPERTVVLEPFERGCPPA